MFRSPFRVWSSLVVIVGGYLTLAMGQPRQTPPTPFELREAPGKPGSILLPQGLETGATAEPGTWPSPFALGPIAQGAGAAPPAAAKANPPTSAAPATPAKASQPPAPPAKPAPVLTMDMVLSRETPRKLLETFYFAIEGAEFKPDLLQTAVQCLDNNAFQGDPTTLGLTAVHLGEILDHFDVSHLAGPDRTTGTSVVILKEGEFTIALRHQPGDGWRFDADTVVAIPEMRRDLIKMRSNLPRKPANMSEGRQSPEALVRTFRTAIARRDFLAAASCLDPSGNTTRRWELDGPGHARKLAYIIQRCGFLFSNECPNDPEGPRFTWHASAQGLISMARTTLPDGKDAWVFDRSTILSIPALLEEAKKQPLDPRWVRLGMAMDDSFLREERTANGSRGNTRETNRPANLPPGQETPRALLETFFKGIERLRMVTGKPGTVILNSCLDLEPARRHLGRDVSVARIAIMLDAVLRTFELDSIPISDVWNDDPQTLKGPNGAEVILRRGEDGGWKFDFESLIRLPDMYAKLPPGVRSAREKLHDFDTPRSTFATFEWSMFRAETNPSEIQKAVGCLDLSGVPAAARPNLGPRIAWKIRYILDHQLPEEIEKTPSYIRKFPLIQLIPNQPDGRRWAPARNADGEVIAISRAAEGPNKDKWLFTADTIDRAEKHFSKLLDGETVSEVVNAYPWEQDPNKRVAYWFREGPEFWECPAVWVHMRIPSAWRVKHVYGINLGLELWQWFGLLLASAGAYGVGWIGTQLINLMIKLMLGKLTRNLPPGRVFKRLAPVRVVVGFQLLLYGIDCLDLPMAVEITILPISKTIWAVLVLWTMLGMVDLGRDLWEFREDQESSSNLQDLLIPTVVGLVKAMLFLGFGYFLIRLMGDEDLLNRILAGLGILTLGVSLAAQDAIKNYFGTLLLASERPFRIGDRVALAGQNGVIEQVGYRSTRIRTDKGSLIVIPNSKVIEGSVENLGRRNRHFARLSLPLSGVPGEDNAPALIKEIQLLLRQLCPRVHKQPQVSLLGPADGGPSLMIRAWLPGWGGAPAAQGREKFLTQLAAVLANRGLIILGPPQSPASTVMPMKRAG